MANLFYDFDLRSLSVPVQPYLGVGVGYGWRHHDARAFGTAGVPYQGTLIGVPTTRRFSDTSGSLAYQAITGLA